MSKSAAQAVVLDASALIASIRQEPGADMVDHCLSCAVISTVNMAEVATYLVRTGYTRAEVEMLLSDLAIPAIPFDAESALDAAALIPKTAPKGLSLADRICIATAARYGLPVLTADKIWGSLKLGVKITVIR